MIITSRNALLTFTPAILALGLITACGQIASKDSAVKVTNGVEDSATDHPSTVLLVMNLPQGQGLCTGTFVNDHQVVTAGHCVEGLDRANPAMVFAVEKDGKFAPGPHALSYERNPEYSIDKGVSQYDVSVITFPANSAPGITPLASEAPSVGTEFTIIGFGNNKDFMENGTLNGSGAGVKREGKNTVQALQDGMIVFAGLSGTETVDAADVGTNVSSGEGDSGGPMLIANKLVGVTSGGGFAKGPDGADISVSEYVDLNNPVNKKFLAGALHKTSRATPTLISNAGL